jgi:hypothetical protein
MSMGVDFEPNLCRYPTGLLGYLLTSTKVSTGSNKVTSENYVIKYQVFYNCKQTTYKVKIVNRNKFSATVFKNF